MLTIEKTGIGSKKRNLEGSKKFFLDQLEKYFSIIPILAVSGIGYFSIEHPKPATLSFTFGIIPTFALCFAI